MPAYVYEPISPAPRTFRERMGSIYFISDGVAVKIGFSFSPHGRVSNLQVGNSRTLKILASIPGSLSDEDKVHRHFGRRRLHGEWFDISEEEAMAFVEQRRATDNNIRELTQKLSDRLVGADQDTKQQGERVIFALKQWKPGRRAEGRNVLQEIEHLERVLSWATA